MYKQRKRKTNFKGKKENLIAKIIWKDNSQHFASIEEVKLSLTISV